MANSFHRVTQSLRADNGGGSSAALLIALGLLAAWLLWAFLSPGALILRLADGITGRH